MNHLRLFHVSEKQDIKLFEPRPSPQAYGAIKGNVVFAVSNQLLHNYLLPRNCPRVCYYKSAKTTAKHIEQFYKDISTDYVIAIEREWFEQVKQTPLYCYEFATDGFALLDECAGYYVSYNKAQPINMFCIDDPITELAKRNVTLLLLPSLQQLAKEVAASTLNFSLIRMRNAKG